MSPGIPVTWEIHATNSGEFNSSVTAPRTGGNNFRFDMPILFSFACLYWVQASLAASGNSCAIEIAVSMSRKSRNRICGQGLFSWYWCAKDSVCGAHFSYENKRLEAGTARAVAMIFDVTPFCDCS